MRHGRTAATKARIYCGISDPPLSDDTRGEIEETAARLPVFSHVYASDLVRARQTARIAAPDMDVRLRPALREIDFGAFDGLLADEIAARMPEQWQHYLDNAAAFTFPGGDSVPAFAARVLAEVRAIAAAHDGECVLVVTHKGVISAALSMLLHGDVSRMFCYEVRPAGFVRLMTDGESTILRQLC